MVERSWGLATEGPLRSLAQVQPEKNVRPKRGPRPSHIPVPVTEKISSSGLCAGSGIVLHRDGGAPPPRRGTAVAHGRETLRKPAGPWCGERGPLFPK